MEESREQTGRRAVQPPTPSPHCDTSDCGQTKGDNGSWTRSTKIRRLPCVTVLSAVRDEWARGRWVAQQHSGEWRSGVSVWCVGVGVQG